jgi:transposase-like protein
MNSKISPNESVTPTEPNGSKEPRRPVNSRKGVRHRSAAERRRIVEETFEPGISVAGVARRHGINANQIFTWRRLYRAGKLGRAEQGFIPVEVIGENRPALPPPNTATSGKSKIGAAPSCWPAEVELQNQVKVRLSSGVDADFMRRILHLARELA